MSIKLNVDTSAFNSIYVTDKNLTDYSHRWEVYFGSAGSGKSYFIACKLILKALTYPGRRILICRKYGTTLKHSVMQIIKEVLLKYKIYDYCKISDHNRVYVLPNKSELIFLGLDTEEKLLSIQDISDIWVEEATEVEKDIVEQLNLRMRGSKPNQTIFLSFNPISQHHWLHEFCTENTPKSFKLIHSTYKDNRFLPEEYIESMDGLYLTNPRKAVVYCDGQWGNDPDGMVFQNVKVKAFDINALMERRLEIRIGCDTGFIDSTAVIVSLFDHASRECYIIQEIYKPHLSLDQIYNELVNNKILHYNRPIYCDSADQRAIAFLQSKKVRVIPATKGAGSIEMGIGFLQNYTIYIHPSCANTIKEFDTYSYFKDPKTGRYVDGKYEKVFGDHAIDAVRYSVSDLYTKKTINIINKRSLGL